MNKSAGALKRKQHALPPGLHPLAPFHELKQTWSWVLLKHRGKDHIPHCWHSNLTERALSSQSHGAAEQMLAWKSALWQEGEINFKSLLFGMSWNCWAYTVFSHFGRQYDVVKHLEILKTVDMGSICRYGFYLITLGKFLKTWVSISSPVDNVKKLSLLERLVVGNWSVNGSVMNF